jgi:hypothetical protein
MPIPLPPPAAPLRTITHERVMPSCEALLNHVAPAIEQLRNADKAIGQGLQNFGRLSHDAVMGASLKASMHRLAMENQITPIVASMQQANAQIDKLGDTGEEGTIKAALRKIVQRQNDALNAITGYVYTEQLVDLENADTGIPPLVADPNAPTLLPTPGPTPAPGGSGVPADESGAQNFLADAVHDAESSAARAIASDVYSCESKPSKP